MDKALIAKQIPDMLLGTDFKDFGEKYEGKVRDNYIKNGRRILITTDRLSAFDRIIANIPFKGQVLNAMTKFWFEATSDICGNHVEAYPDPNVMVGLEAEAFKVEMVIRSYLTGTTTTSIWHHYKNGGRNFCGNVLPDNLEKNTKLPHPIITPSTKADKGGHDVSLSIDEILDAGVLSSEDFEFLQEKTKALFQRGQEICEARGVILVDTKYEFGKLPDGRIILIDEIHTPDSSRFWVKENYETAIAEGIEPDNINKEFLRLWLSKNGYMGEGPVPEIPEDILIETAYRYIRAYELVSGKKFEPVLGPPLPRITENLSEYLN